MPVMEANVCIVRVRGQAGYCVVRGSLTPHRPRPQVS
jgi:hypothetical protein